MTLAIDPFRLLLISLAGWLNQRQQDVIDYLQEENRVLREQLGGKRLRFSDDQPLAWVKSLSRLALASGRSQSLVKWLQPDSVLLLQVVVVPVNNSLTLGDCQFARPNILDPAGLRRFGPAISDNAQARHLCLIRAVRRPEPLELLHNLRLHKRTD